MEGEKRRVGNISFRGWRMPECPERTSGQPHGLLTTFSLMDNHFGENLIELR